MPFCTVSLRSLPVRWRAAVSGPVLSTTVKGNAARTMAVRLMFMMSSLVWSLEDQIVKIMWAHRLDPDKDQPDARVLEPALARPRTTVWAFRSTCLAPRLRLEGRQFPWAGRAPNPEAWRSCGPRRFL